jgi:LacI family transcriptional regulator
MRVTIKDVARQASVSQTTVSLVLNEAPGVSPQKRAHVLRVMKELNYKPCALARSFSSRRAEAIAMVIPAWQESFENPYYTRQLSGVLETMRDRGYKMLLEIADRRFTEQKLWQDLIERKRVDGLLIVSSSLDQDYLQELAALAYPALLLNGARPDLPALDFIGYDDARCGREATYYLLGLGHRRVAHLTGRMNHASGVDRLKGYCEALERAQLPLYPEDILPGNYEAGSGRAAIQALLARPVTERPTALFCANDEMALEAMQVSQEAGLSVPGDLSIIGVDDIAEAARANPPLTTMRQDLYDLSRLAADRFIQKLENRTAVARIEERLPMPLVERATCAPPKQRRGTRSKQRNMRHDLFVV